MSAYSPNTVRMHSIAHRASSSDSNPHLASKPVIYEKAAQQTQMDVNFSSSLSSLLSQKIGTIAAKEPSLAGLRGQAMWGTQDVYTTMGVKPETPVEMRNAAALEKQAIQPKMQTNLQAKLEQVGIRRVISSAGPSRGISANPLQQSLQNSISTRGAINSSLISVQQRAQATQQPRIGSAVSIPFPGPITKPLRK